MTREMAFAILDRIAGLRGNETIPTEDVIDLAQAAQYLFGDILERKPRHSGRGKDAE